jgi:competence protein ComEC
MEYVEIASRSETDRDITDWTVSGSKGEETFVFPPGYVLAAGVTIRLHSGKEGLDAPPGDIYWTDKTIWNNDGETVYLKDASGTVISQYRY